MSVFSFGQSDWYAVAMLLVQLGFLFAGVWFARNFLKTIRGFQEQVGALVKLSLTGSPAEQDSASTIARRTLGETAWLMPTEAQPVRVKVPADRGVNRADESIHRYARTESSASMLGLGAEHPSEPTREHGPGPGMLRRIGQWLQTPLNTKPMDEQATGWRRMVRWLEAPAGS
jgi:hypothetical protein